MKSGLSFIAIVIVLISACERPPKDDGGTDVLPITFAVSLKDSLPASTFHLLSEPDVQGIRLLDLYGNDIRYFSYHMEANTLIQALSLSPFSIEAISADTVCRRLENNNLSRDQFKANELSRATAFLEAKDSHEIYEIIKPPLRHLVLINRSTHEVLHRVSNM
jgi:hypothetical protein